MRKEYEASGKTIDQAIDKACALAGTTIDNVEVEILELGGRGIFGFGQKDARVRVILELPDPPQEKEKPVLREDRPQRAPERSSNRGEKTFRPERTDKNKVEKTEAEKPVYKEKTEQPRQNNRENSAKEGSHPERAPRPQRPAAVGQGEKSEPKNRENKAPAKTGKPAGEGRRDPRRENRPVGNRPERSDNPRRGESYPRSESHVAMVTQGEMEQELTQMALAFLQPIFVKLQCDPQVVSQVKEGILWLSLTGGNLGLLIGRRGDTLNSLQYLTNLAVNKHRAEHVRLVLDVEGYRANREETLTALAHKMADKAVRTGRRVEFEPMNPHERRIVHLALQNDKRVDTGSRGEEPYRRVVISRRRTDKKRAAMPGTGGVAAAPDLPVTPDLPVAPVAPVMPVAPDVPVTPVTPVTAPVAAPEQAPEQTAAPAREQQE